MDKIVVEGGRPLKGAISVSGSKNAALPMLFATLLADGVSVLENVPNLVDIQSTNLLLAGLGAKVAFENNWVEVDTRGLCCPEAPYDLVRKMRASVLALGPLLARMKKARVSLPGGCAIGERPIDYHLEGLKRLGVSVEIRHGYVEASVHKLVGSEIFFDQVSVTGTENIMMAATLAEGESTLRNAAREPEIVALAEMLNQMGAKIEGAGTAIIKIMGVPSLSPAKTTVIADRIEAGTILVAGVLTRGDILLQNCNPEHMGTVLHKLQQAGAMITHDDNSIHVRANGGIRSVNVKTLPYPGFPTDMQAQFMVLMTAARGQAIITETIFENRFIHVSELKRMGADITITGNNAIVKGVSSLSGAPVMASDLRASASLVLAGLVAKGQTVVSRIYHLDRGYEALEKKFEQLGAAIKRVK